MHVLLDVHGASDDQQSAVACSIASSHEDLHEVTSISSCADLNSQSVLSKYWLQTVPSTNFGYGQLHRNLRNNFGVHYEVLHEFSIHHAVLDQFFIHHDLLITLSKLSFEGVETCHSQPIHLIHFS